MIPPNAQAQADVRVLKVEDYDGIEKKVRETLALVKTIRTGK